MSNETPFPPLPPTPAGACDCHMHLIDHAYPFAPTASFKPAEAKIPDYLKIQKRLGLARCVVVQPNAYAGDNSLLLSALEELGGQARGVAVVSREDFQRAGSATLADLRDRNVRGLRFHLLPGGLLDWDDLKEMAPAAADAGLHLDLQFDGRNLPDHLAFLKKLPGNLVIDHTAKFLEPVVPEHEAFLSLLRLVETGKAWVKLSAPYETSRSGPPLYGDLGVLAAELGKRAPERLLWASNWPHLSPNPGAPKPDEGDLLAWLYHWVPNPDSQARILGRNPAELYGF